MNMARLLVMAFALFAFVSAAPANESQAPRSSLFNGHDLAGWHVLGCTADVENGALVIKDGNGLVRTHHRYADFILELKYKPRRAEKYDSGIYVRCELPLEGKPFPERYQVNLKHQDECNLIGFPRARSTGLVKPGEWNAVKLTVMGEKIECEINGQAAWQAEGIKERVGYIALQVEVPGGGQYEFKDIFITELGYQPLFNGVDLSGWEGGGGEANQCWKVEGGELVCTGKPGPWLRSTREVADFNLRLEYKLKAGGNSGVYVRVDKEGKHHAPDEGVEVQILDDASPRYAKLEPGQYSASVYKIVPANPRVSRPAGKWNTLEINCRGANYSVIHNGVMVVDGRADKMPELVKHRLAGFLGLQNHDEEVRFRDIRLGAAAE